MAEDNIDTFAKEREAAIAELVGGKQTEDSPPEASEGSDTKSAEGQPLQNKETDDSEQAAKPEASEGEGKGEADEAKLESRYEKLAKEKARLAKSWQKMDSERESIKAERAALDQQRAEIERAREEYQRQLASDAIGKSPEMYRKAAEGLREEGEIDLAEQAERIAKELEQQKSEASKNVAITDAKKQWDESVKQAIKENPELNDPNSQLFQEVTGLLKTKQVLGTYPGGFNDALEVAKTIIEARKAQSLESKISELSKELEKYKAMTSLGSSGGGVPRPSQKSFDEMTEEEMRAHILRMIPK